VPLVDRINSGLAELRQRDGQLSLNDWADYFSFGGNTYPFVQTTMGQVDRESVGVTSVAGFKSSGPVFSLVLARLQAFSQVRFQWTRFQGSQPTDLFGSPELAVLERPWNGGTTSDLLARMEIHASVAGCAYVTRPQRDRLSMLRPDRVTIVMGSQTDADDPSEAPDAEIIGFLHTTSHGKMTVFGPNEVAYYAPIPDPDYRFLGMSWITPVLRDLMADSLATEHKARFFVNSATPNLAIKFDASVGIEKVRQFKALLESEHKGAFNAWKTLYLGGGADPVPVGSSFKDMDYAVIQGRAESRLAAAAGVPPSWVGFAEGLQGSSLNAGNFNSARRRFSDGTMVHLWTNAATSLEVLLSRPQGATLWYDPRVPFMREDAEDLAGIQQKQAETIVKLSTSGFTRESAIAAVTKNDFNLLVKDPNWVSVQLQQSNGQPPAGGAGPKAPAAPAARRFNPDEPRDPHGKWVGGGAVKDALKLADRIQLGKDEHLAGSAKVGDGRGDYSTVMARVDGPNGPRLRFGVVDTSEGTKKWRGANGGATVVLDQHGAGELRRVVADAQVKGPKSVADYRADIKARHARGEPDSEWPSPEADIAQGVIHGSAWGDIHWTLTREEGPDYIVGGVNLGPGGKWLLSLDVKAAENKLGPLDSFDIYSSGVAQKLDGALADLMGI
jgi:phage portal protein BeeE